MGYLDRSIGSMNKMDEVNVSFVVKDKTAGTNKLWFGMFAVCLKAGFCHSVVLGTAKRLQKRFYKKMGGKIS